jgi:hypothetical protein
MRFRGQRNGLIFLLRWSLSASETIANPISREAAVLESTAWVTGRLIGCKWLDGKGILGQL